MYYLADVGFRLNLMCTTAKSKHRRSHGNHASNQRHSNPIGCSQLAQKGRRSSSGGASYLGTPYLDLLAKLGETRPHNLPVCGPWFDLESHEEVRKKGRGCGGFYEHAPQDVQTRGGKY